MQGQDHQTTPALAYAPALLALAVFIPPALGAGWVADDAVNLASHANEGDLIGEWTTSTYAHAGRDRGHIWRPIPATLQHLVALGFGRTAVAFRALNIAIHVLNVVLVQRLARSRGATARTAAVLAALFAAHPVVPDAVCWSSDVYDLVACSFVLSTLLAATSPLRLTTRSCMLTLLTFAACLSKESAVAMVPVVALLATLRGRGLRDSLFSTVASGLGALSYLVIHSAVTGQSYAEATGQTPVIHQALAGLSAAGWMVWPPFKSAHMAHLFDPGEVLAPTIGALTISALICIATYVRRDTARARDISAATASLVVLLVPAAIAIPLIGVQAVRYAYLPVAVALALLAPSLNATSALTVRIGSIVVLSVALLGTVPRTFDFQNDGTLWAAELEVEPDNPYAASGLARWLLKEGENEQALSIWARAVDNAPAGGTVFNRENERWLLAQAAFLRGKPELAHAQVLAFIHHREQSGSPVPGPVWCLLADSLDQLGESGEAAEVATRCQP